MMGVRNTHVCSDKMYLPMKQCNVEVSVCVCVCVCVKEEAEYKAKKRCHAVGREHPPPPDEFRCGSSSCIQTTP